MLLRNRGEVREVRICVLGNSHVAGLKLGLELMPASRRKFEMVFFASRAGSLAALELRDQVLVPSTPSLAKAIAHTSGGKGEVVLADYDAFVVYGLGLPLPSLERQLTAAVQRQVCRDTLVQSLNFQVCKLIRQASDKPVFVGHDPQQAAGRRRADLSTLVPYEVVFDRMRRELARDDLQLVRQPQQTFADAWFTDPSLSVGSVRLDIGDEKSNELHGESDNKHMNGQFGRLWLEALLAGMQVTAEA